MSVYFIHCPATGRVKIGHAKDPAQRLKDLQTGSASVLAILGTVPGAAAEEGRLHQRFADLRQQGEWFAAGDSLKEFLAEKGFSLPLMPVPDPPSKANGLAGRWFHTRDPDGTIRNQGQILEHRPNDMLVVQFYSFMTGDETTRKVIPLADSMTTYATDREMRKVYRQEGVSKRRLSPSRASFWEHLEEGTPYRPRIPFTDSEPISPADENSPQ